MGRTFYVIGCPAVRKNIPVRSCAGCQHQAELVGCKHHGRTVPADFCRRVCTLQRGMRGEPDAFTGDRGPLGVRLPPIVGEALCGAPWVMTKWGVPRPIFGGSDEPIEDPEKNIVAACTFPRALGQPIEVCTDPPEGLEV